MSKKKVTEDIREDLAVSIADTLNKQHKDYKVAYFLDGDIDVPTNVTDYVSTGSSILDLVISNRKNGGFPVGRIVEITGLEACVTEDTIIDIKINDEFVKVKIGEIKQLLQEGKRILVRGYNGYYCPISNYIEKGIMDTYKVTLNNGNNIKCSLSHKFFTNIGWVECKDLILNESLILCEDDTYSSVKEVLLIGKYEIVDISVDSEYHSYFGNGMLNHNSGKSLLAAHTLANTQKMNGVAVYIDTESAVSKEFLEAIGVDNSKLVYSQLETVEDIFSAIESIIEKVRSSSKDKIVTIVVDSLAAASTKTEMESEYDKDGWATSKAIIISKAMRKITNMIARQKILLVFTNQLRQKLGVMGVGEQYTTSGGKALGFHASVRLRLSAIGKIKKGEEVIGIKCKSQVIKNRIGPPLRNATYDMYFSYGIDDNSDMFNYLKEKELLLKQSGAWYTILDKNNKEIKFQLKDWNDLLKNNLELREYIYDTISENVIMKYDNISNVEIGETKIDSSVEDE